MNRLFLFFSFYADFGPLNLAQLHRYCTKVNKKLKVILVLYLKIQFFCKITISAEF